MQAAFTGAAQGFGGMAGGSSGYGQAGFAQAGMSPYGQSANSFQAGQKRDSGYDQVSGVSWAAHTLRCLAPTQFSSQ